MLIGSIIKPMPRGKIKLEKINASLRINLPGLCRQTGRRGGTEWAVSG